METIALKVFQHLYFYNKKHPFFLFGFLVLFSVKTKKKKKEFTKQTDQAEILFGKGERNEKTPHVK